MSKIILTQGYIALTVHPKLVCNMQPVYTILAIAGLELCIIVINELDLKYNIHKTQVVRTKEGNDFTYTHSHRIYLH